jgi:ParB family chromosome partitioning protein
MADDHKPRLGRGLAALLGTSDDTPERAPAGRLKRVPIEKLRPNPRNPRRQFHPEELQELADSIKSRGVLQPIVVREDIQTPGQFEIVAGERRWRASQSAGLSEVPVVVIEADDRLALEIAIVENVQRADLNPLEEAEGYGRLMAEYHYTQADMAAAIGKSRSHVANMVRLLKLPTSVRDLVRDGQLTAGHARALLAVDDPAAVAGAILARGLSVRQVEQWNDKPKTKIKKNSEDVHDGDANVKALSKVLTEQTGLSISIVKSVEGGRVVIEYKSLEQFDYIFAKLNEW